NAQAGADDPVRQAQAASTLRRSASACGAGTFAGQKTEAAAARRTDGRAGQEAAFTDATGTGRDHRARRRDVRDGDSRPGRGHD
nr:hypothetical protein [Tanacetum cinerariifolium]